MPVSGRREHVGLPRGGTYAAVGGRGVTRLGTALTGKRFALFCFFPERAAPLLRARPEPTPGSSAGKPPRPDHAGAGPTLTAWTDDDKVQSLRNHQKK